MKIMVCGPFMPSCGRKIDVGSVLRTMFYIQMACRKGQHPIQAIFFKDWWSPIPVLRTENLYAARWLFKGFFGSVCSIGVSVYQGGHRNAAGRMVIVAGSV